MSKSGVIEPVQMSLLDDPGLSDDERIFADAYIATGFNAGEAYQSLGRKASDKSASQIGKRWLQRDSIRQYLRQRLGALAEQAELTQAEVVQGAREVFAIGTGKIPVRKTLVGKEGGARTLHVFDPNLGAANGALGILAKVVGIGDGDGGLGAGSGESLSPTERAARVAALIERRRRLQGEASA